MAPTDSDTSNWNEALEKAALTQECKESIREFCRSVQSQAKFGPNLQTEDTCGALLTTYIRLVEEECRTPKIFDYYHQDERKPFDYYQFGLDLVRPLIDWNHSQILGQESLLYIEQLLQAGENVILLSNHQSEIDPQVISLLIEKSTPKLAEEMIFVAGHRVVTDPMAIPFSRGRNLLCIYSKRYLENSPEARAEKLQHNSKTLSALEELLNSGGKCIYVAPSGGRDRKASNGLIEVAPFDPSSVELFLLLGQRSAKKTHFVPFSLFTYDLLPPPEEIRVQLGEPRIAKFAPAGVYFTHPVDPTVLSTSSDKKAARKERADQIHQIVVDNYKKIVRMCTCNR